MVESDGQKAYNRDMKAKIAIWIAGIVLALAMLGVLLARHHTPEIAGTPAPPKAIRPPRQQTSDSPRKIKHPTKIKHSANIGSSEADLVESKSQDDDETQTPMNEEEKRQADEEEMVEAFDALTDKWMEPAKTGVSMKDVDTFAERFRDVPKDRKEECLHRALNLVPDENVMLLAGILMDKSQDKELVELVFNDVLNRGENVKKPILQQIFKDREHPCWADTAWILDVTGEVPQDNM